MHNFIQKLRDALKGKNAMYAELKRFLALLQTLHFAFAPEPQPCTTLF
jgi:hypothetical protein